MDSEQSKQTRMTKEYFAMLSRATGPSSSKDEQIKTWFLLSEEYQDFKEFISDEFGIDEFEQLWEKFQNRSVK